MCILALLAGLCHLMQGGILVPVAIDARPPAVKPNRGPLTNLVFSNSDGTIGRWSFSGLQGRLEEATYPVKPITLVGPPPIVIPVTGPVAGAGDPRAILVFGGPRTPTHRHSFRYHAAHRWPGPGARWRHSGPVAPIGFGGRFTLTLFSMRAGAGQPEDGGRPEIKSWPDGQGGPFGKAP